MALIARQIYQHTDLIRYMSDYNYHFVKSEKQPDDFWISNTNDFLTGEMDYDGVVGGKTGYTDQARETLVTFAEREDVHLICVIIKEEPPYEYYDTIDLLNYAFDNFTKVNIKESERKYTLSSPDFLSFGPDIFGKSEPAYRIEETSSLMIPKKASFSDLDSEIIPLTYETASGQDSKEERKKKKEKKVKGTNTNETHSESHDKKTEDKADKQTEAQAGTRTDSSTGLSGSSLPEINRKDGSRLLGQIHYSYHGYDLTTADVLFLPVQKKLFPRKTSLTADNSGEGSSSGLESSSLENAGLLQEEDTTDGDGTETVKQDESTEETNTVNAIQEEIQGIRAFFFNTVHTGAHGSIYINILVVLPLLLIVSFFLCVFFFINSYFARLKRMRMRKTRRTVKKPAPGSPSNRPSNPSGSSRNRRSSSTPTFRGRQ